MSVLFVGLVIGIIIGVHHKFIWKEIKYIYDVRKRLHNEKMKKNLTND